MPLLETLRLSAALRARNRALREEQGAPFREGTHRDREKEPSPYFRCARPLATGMLTPVGPTQKASKHGPKPCNYSSPGWSTFHVVDRSYLHQLKTLLPLRLPLPPFLLTTAFNRHHPFFASPSPPLHLLPLRFAVVYPRSFSPTSSSVCSPCTPYSFLSFSRLRHTLSLFKSDNTGSLHAEESVHPWVSGFR